VNPKDTAIPAVASDEWAKKLDDKERLFVEGYLQTLNKRQAAECAGYSHETAKRFAYEIFKRAHVREAIEHLLRTRTGVTKTWLIDKLVAIIDTDLADVSDWDVERQLAWPVILPHSRMLPSRVIVASFKCSSTLPSAEPALQGGDGLDPAVRPPARTAAGPSLSVTYSHPDSARDRFSGCRECIAPNTMVCAISLRQILSRRWRVRRSPSP
jgi:hypothetical protein